MPWEAQATGFPHDWRAYGSQLWVWEHLSVDSAARSLACCQALLPCSTGSGIRAVSSGLLFLRC